MAGMVSPNLPPLRQELTLHPGSPGADGAPVWILADPVRNRFFHIDWVLFEILSRWQEGSAARILERLRQETRLMVGAEALEETARFLIANHLVHAPTPGHSRAFAGLVLQEKQQWLKKLLHHYLFFRIPLAWPDRFLGRTLPWVSIFFSRGYAWFLALVAVSSGFLLLRQWDLFQATLMSQLHLTGLLKVGLSLMLVKSVHELGHAYVAKRHGCRVPTMGVAFLVLFPMLYTDTTEAWKLYDRKKRLAIALAGIKAEGALALLALLAWNLLPPGPARETAFWIATTSLATTLAINLSPFMRFDGYFVLSDWLDLPNLHERSFDLARWRLREWLFSPGLPPPERTTTAWHWFLVLFALATWAYRLVLFLGIAFLVYHFFIKIIGIILFSVEVAWFIMLPIWREVRAWFHLKAPARRRWLLPLLIIGAVIGFMWPFSGEIAAPALAQAASLMRIYVPEASRLRSLPQPATGKVAQGAVLFVLESPEIARQAQLTRVRLGGAQWQLDAAGLTLDWARQARVISGEAERSATTLAGLDAAGRRLTLRAPFSGRLVDVPPDLAVGAWLGSGFHLATLVDEGEIQVEAWLDEQTLGRLESGARGRFVPDVPEYPALPLELAEDQAAGVTELDEPLLSSLHGGPVTARILDGVEVPEEALFRLRFVAPAPPGWPPHRLRGTVHLEAAPDSLFTRASRAMLMVLIREWKM